MDGISNVTKVIIVGVIAAILIIIVILYGIGGGSSNMANNGGSSSTSATLAASSPSETGTGSQSGSNSGQGNGVGTTGSAPTVNIKMVTPLVGDQWKIGFQNPISWTKAGKFSGDIYLIDAETNAFIGVILPQIGPQQNSYTWNTRDVFLDRTNPLKKDVTPGTYIIKIAYDGNNIPVITSPKFTITN